MDHFKFIRKYSNDPFKGSGRKARAQSADGKGWPLVLI
jgi:hypothetical protein